MNRREIFLIVVAAVVSILLAGAVIAGALSYLGWPNSPPDRLATLGDSISVATLVLAIAAGVVALAAYLVAIRRPDLEASVTFGGNPPNNPDLALNRNIQAPEHLVALIEGRQLRATVELSNKSEYAARYPAVRLELFGFTKMANHDGWAEVPPTSNEATMALQWEEPGENLIHGKWHRQLPDLNFLGVFCDTRIARKFLRIALMADGWRKKPFDIEIRTH